MPCLNDKSDQMRIGIKQEPVEQTILILICKQIPGREESLRNQPEYYEHGAIIAGAPF